MGFTRFLAACRLLEPIMIHDVFNSTCGLHTSAVRALGTQTQGLMVQNNDANMAGNI